MAGWCAPQHVFFHRTNAWYGQQHTKQIRARSSEEIIIMVMCLLAVFLLSLIPKKCIHRDEEACDKYNKHRFVFKQKTLVEHTKLQYQTKLALHLFDVFSTPKNSSFFPATVSVVRKNYRLERNVKRTSTSSCKISARPLNSKFCSHHHLANALVGFSHNLPQARGRKNNKRWCVMMIDDGADAESSWTTPNLLAK